MTHKCFNLRHQQALLVIMFLIFSFAGVEPHRDGSHKHQKSHNSFDILNSFETMNHTKVIAQIGGTAILPCIVEVSSPATVNWIRRKDFHLLTVGLATYSSDERFNVGHVRHTKGIWDLRIKSVRKDDEGMYECNLSLHPPESIFIQVIVVEAFAEIATETDLHIDEGSTLKLECKIFQLTEDPSYVFWYHDDRMVNFNFLDGYSVQNVPKVSSSLNNEPPELGTSDIVKQTPIDSSYLIKDQKLSNVASSILFVQEVQFTHAGNYTCAPSNTRPTWINVHVLKGDKPAAMKHSNKSTSIDEKSTGALLRGYQISYSILGHVIVTAVTRILLNS